MMVIEDSSTAYVVPRGRSVFARTFRIDPRLKAVLDLEALEEHLEKQGVSGARAHLAYNLVTLQRGLSVREQRALFLAILVSLEAGQGGSTFVPLERGMEGYLARRFRGLIPRGLQREEPWRPAGLVEAFFEIVDGERAPLILGAEGEFRPLIVQENRLYHQRVLLAEDRLVAAVRARLMEPAPQWGGVEEALKEVRRRPAKVGERAMTLNAEQEYAALTALHSPLALITGGPGTGKTSIVVAMLRLLVRLGVEPGSVALAAPTGKAANRMAESIRKQMESIGEPAEEDERLTEELAKPRTLHRLLRFSPRSERFYHDRENPLPHRVVIVDEASMIDLFLMESLLEAVSEDAQLVLLGDAEQLPSVDTGAVLRDLLPSTVHTLTPWQTLVEGPMEVAMSAEPTAQSAMRLTRSYRMDRGSKEGQEIYGLAQEVRRGEMLSEESLCRRKRGELLRWQGVEWVEPPLDRRGQVDLFEFLDSYFERHLAPAVKLRAFVELEEGRLLESSTRQVRALFEHYQKVRILALTRVFETGAQTINEVLHARYLARRKQGQDFAFAPGEPVMMLVNDYDKNLFNGDQGVVVMHQSRPMVAFPKEDGFAVYPLAGLSQQIELSFAMTVHKSQGSEFERLALVLPQEDMGLLTREILYTGITRAKEGVVIVGSLERLNDGVARPAQRFSAVREKLGGL